MFTVPIGSYFAQKGTNPKIQISVGLFVGLLCLTGATMVSPDSFWLFAILLVMGFTINQASSYMVVIHNVWLWFPESPGLVTGITICGYGAGALIFDPLSTALINPDGLVAVDGRYPESVNERF
jgi:hypothetical protein